MDEYNNRIKSLFIKLAEGKCTPEERLQIIAYLEKDPSREALPSVEELASTGEWPVMPAAAAEAVFENIIQHTPVKQLIPLWKRSWIRIAAALIPVIGLASFFILQYTQKAEFRHYVNNTRKVQTIQLEDGTVIRLNQRTSLSVSKTFTAGKRREVWLEGEAFFAVKYQAVKPFIVHAANTIDVNVLGTAFNVNTFNGNTKVVLNEGSVKINANDIPDAAAILLKPGEMASFNAATKTLSMQKVDTLFHTSWKYNLIAFRGQPLKEVMLKLKEQYGYDIVFDSRNIDNLVFTGYLASDNLQQALLTLEQTFAIKIFLKDKLIHVNNK
ncbi:FecR family protein [Chitinophaga niastensis]|uniref:FecR family protein n=1 Tax=Chitinophaga niastensis TaxID=536980 RepID=A0A2P8HUY9_CHINA|nr:FecR domain-containing protein [Chitinophaga niastensis]PSL50022.1 FecR family protein [Chitinophaga niastensis]